MLVLVLVFVIERKSGIVTDYDYEPDYEHDNEHEHGLLIFPDQFLGGLGYNGGKEAGMVKLELVGVSQYDKDGYYAVLLRDENRILPIMVGLPEASAIHVVLMEQTFPRPLTHDLICNLLAGLRGRLQSVTIYKLENKTFFAHLNIEQLSANGQVEQVLRVDSRPSDGIAIALRVKCPIYADEEVMRQASQDASVLLNPPDDDEDEEGGENIEGEDTEFDE